MFLRDLRSEVESHNGSFLCERLGARDETKTVRFAHVLGVPDPDTEVPGVGRLRDFVDTFGSLVLYLDPVSGEAAKHLASPAAWATLDGDFRDWLESLDEDERAEILPDWIEDCLTIGEEPGSGNYLLMPLGGEDAGAVFFFDHDGFEFTRVADDVIAYVQRLLAPDNGLVTDMAGHLRFIEDDPMVQWWIRELHDNRGNTASTAG